ncbi:MAG: P-loop NTPase [Gemmatimonadota bacterium]|nr:P-loop NTPase [Gemmatimonadota bacterium]
MTSPLAGRELLVVTGKGGVGKSTLAAVLARALAARGRRALVLEVDPRETQHVLLDTAPSDGEILPAGDDVWLQNLRPRDEIEALVRRRIPIALVARAVAASPVFHHFVESAPGLKELAVLGHALRVVRGEIGPGVDTVVLDAPATGHGVSLLAAPLLVAEVLGNGPVAQLAREIAAFVAAGDRCGVVVATLAEEMPVQETLELAEMLATRVGRPPDLVAVNALYPEWPRRRPPGPGDALDLWRQRRAVNDEELTRLRRHWRGAVAELPLIAADAGPALVETLVAALAPALAAEGSA